MKHECSLRHFFFAREQRSLFRLGYSLNHSKQTFAYYKVKMSLYRGYVVMLATFLIRFVGMGIYYSGGLFITPFIVTFDISTGLAALNISIYSAVASVSALASGYLQDALVKRGYTSRPVFALGAILIFIGTFSASYCNSFLSVLFFALCMGIGVGFSCFIAPGVLSQWFTKNNNCVVLFLAVSGGGIGSFAYARIIITMMHAFHEGSEACDPSATDPSACEEWRPTIRYVGILSSSTILAASLVMRLPTSEELSKFENKNKKEENIKESLSKRKAISRTSGSMLAMYIRNTLMRDVSVHNKDTSTEEERTENERMRFSLVDYLEAKGLRRFSINEYYDYVPPRMAELESEFKTDDIPDNYFDTDTKSKKSKLHETTKKDDAISLKQTIQTRTFVLLGIWALSMATMIDSFFIFVPTYADTIELSTNDGGLALTVAGLALLVGNVLIGFVADWFGPKRTFQFSMVGLTCTTFAWQFSESLWSLLLVSFCFGFFTVSTILFVPVLTEVYYETSKHCVLTLVGSIQALEAPGLLGGPVVIGWLIDQYGFGVAVSFCSAGFLVSTVALFLIPSKEKQLQMISDRFGEEENILEMIDLPIERKDELE